jgi:hypothetical protein
MTQTTNDTQTEAIDPRDAEIVHLLKALVEAQNSLSISKRELSELRDTLAGTSPHTD